jgi:sulfate adenylyltransferase
MTSDDSKTTESLLLDAKEASAWLHRSRDWPSHQCSELELCDLGLLMNGAFAPLSGFLGREDTESVVGEMRLRDGRLWPMPINLELDEETARAAEKAGYLALRDVESTVLAVLEVSDVWAFDKKAMAEGLFSHCDEAHPFVARLMQSSASHLVGGRIHGLRMPRYYLYPELHHTPMQLRELFARKGWERVVAFQTRNPMHRAHFEITKLAAESVKAKVLLHPVVGVTRPGDIPPVTRVRCYEALLPRYGEDQALLSLLPLAMRMGGPREALWHSLIRRNYGATHFIIGRDHAGPGLDSTGKPFHGPYDAQHLVEKFSDEIGLTVVPLQMVVYDPEKKSYVTQDRASESSKAYQLSGTELRRRLYAGEEIPEWFTFPEVAKILRRAYPPLSEQGFTVFFTGLSASGKSTLAQALMARLQVDTGRDVTLLDGDVVRTNLSSELGFSREHRDLNIKRIAYVASEITRHGGIALCAPIAPYDRARNEARALIEGRGGFVLVHVSTPLAECERRDPKGLYAKAREGLIKGFTGIDDPYEAPEDAELAIDTTSLEPSEAAQLILDHLQEKGYLV